ncbi:uncharacterized protein [Amphiura filiformis]|uniref:uncharacterized protein n=1 Tax=Amphiura filiformis TaxID=82378 RepID=UPI003B21F2C3
MEHADVRNKPQVDTEKNILDTFGCKNSVAEHPKEQRHERGEHGNLMDTRTKGTTGEGSDSDTTVVVNNTQQRSQDRNQLDAPLKDRKDTAENGSDSDTTVEFEDETIEDTEVFKTKLMDTTKVMDTTQPSLNDGRFFREKIDEIMITAGKESLTQLKMKTKGANMLLKPKSLIKEEDKPRRKPKRKLSPKRYTGCKTCGKLFATADEVKHHFVDTHLDELSIYQPIVLVQQQKRSYASGVADILKDEQDMSQQREHGNLLATPTKGTTGNRSDSDTTVDFADEIIEDTKVCNSKQLGEHGNLLATPTKGTTGNRSDSDTTVDFADDIIEDTKVCNSKQQGEHGSLLATPTMGTSGNRSDSDTTMDFPDEILEDTEVCNSKQLDEHGNLLDTPTKGTTGNGSDSDTSVELADKIIEDTKVRNAKQRGEHGNLLATPTKGTTGTRSDSDTTVDFADDIIEDTEMCNSKQLGEHENLLDTPTKGTTGNGSDSDTSVELADKIIEDTKVRNAKSKDNEDVPNEPKVDGDKNGSDTLGCKDGVAEHPEEQLGEHGNLLDTPTKGTTGNGSDSDTSVELADKIIEDTKVRNSKSKDNEDVQNEPKVDGDKNGSDTLGCKDGVAEHPEEQLGEHGNLLDTPTKGTTGNGSDSDTSVELADKIIEDTKSA